VRYFLASVAPDIDQANDRALAAATQAAPNVVVPTGAGSDECNSHYPSAPWSPPAVVRMNKPVGSAKPAVQLASAGISPTAKQPESISLSDLTKNGWYEPLKTLLAAVGLTAITLRLLKMVR
jgi:hypothetical protein